MSEKSNLGGLPATRNKYTSAFKAKCVRQVAVGIRQSDGPVFTHAIGALVRPGFGNRREMERDKNVVTILQLMTALIVCSVNDW